MMGADPRLMALHALRKRAEEEARSCHDAQVAAIKAKHHGYYAQDLIDALPPAWVDVDAHLSLLSDLTRPESRDAVARLVAEALLVPVEFSAPSLWRMAHTVWAFAAMSDCSEAVKNDGVWFIPTPGSTADRIRSVPALAGVTDPAEALTLIALAVFGGAS